MKILFLAQYITIDDNPAFMRNRTGYGYMVKDISESVGKRVQVDLLTISGFTEDTYCDHIHLLSKTWWKTLSHFKLTYIFLWYKLIAKYKFSVKRCLQQLFYYISLGYIEHILKKGKYNLVHIHGVGGITLGYEEVCRRSMVPYLITLHGLNSFENVVSMEEQEKKIELDFLDRAYKKNISLTFISTGIEKQVEAFLHKKCVTFSIVPNGTAIKRKVPTSNIRNDLNLKPDDFLFTYVGNISARKNQIQVARSFLLLPEELRNKTKIIFVGKENDDGLSNFISHFNLSERLFCIGNVPKDEIHNYYIAADATIMSSLSEGFGLSIIEGFVYGKPNVTFADLAAVPDLYNERAMLLVNERTDVALADGMKGVINAKWDCEWIKSYAENFSLERMAQNYIEVYKGILNEK